MALNGEVIINTGNILNLIDIKKKAGQNATEELTDSIKITLDDWRKHENPSNGYENGHEIFRSNDDTKIKMTEEDRKDLKVGIKIFVNDDCPVYLEKCLTNVYKNLNIKTIDNAILAYNPRMLNGNQNEVKTNGDAIAENSDADELKCNQILPGVLKLWNVLETYVNDGRISQIGVSDLEEMCFKKLHSLSKVKPTIVQINLASCCVVPPGLQTFCKENDIQLLTHSDPHEIISKEILSNIVSKDVKKMNWCVKYQVHIKCRGVLALKGYILCTTID